MNIFAMAPYIGPAVAIALGSFLLIYIAVRLALWK